MFHRLVLDNASLLSGFSIEEMIKRKGICN